MGVYYKIVNLERKERVEPGAIGGGGIKSGAVVLGPSSRLLAFLSVHYGSGWSLVADESDDEAYHESTDRGHDHYCNDMTEHYVQKFNEWAAPEHWISLYGEGDKVRRT